MSGRCAAADIESLRRIRDGKLCRKLNCTWREYCARHLHVAIANHVSDNGVKLDGAIIALVPVNNERVAGAVPKLLSRTGPRQQRTEPRSFEFGSEAMPQRG